ncbi:hypothetical protein ACFQ36_05990 [Arthrobacter sp. GCM10027362]|uniref:hypothetical protein n=1 Tax=Arthrobacter sp. GCM10027362 TaxID=3273379 RepID=UPI003640F5A9
MKRIFIALLLLLTTTSASAGTSGLPCVLSPEAMPRSWQPSDKVRKDLAHRADAGPWSASEAEEARYAIRTGLDEMINLYTKRPKAAEELWEDSVASLIEVTYSSANTPEFDARARDAARRNLTALIRPYLERTLKSAKCNEYDELLPLAIYAHTRYQQNDARIAKMVQLANFSYHACGSLTAAMGIDYKPMLEAEEVSTEDAFDMVIWSLLFIEGQLVPDLYLPAEASDFPATFWRFIEDYQLAGARTYKDGARDEKFIDAAYLATHIAYIPTGNHRYPIYVEDSPRLYQFHRENFYAVLEMGELDLVAEFVDSLRQYGCTPENDLQVRDGTRFLLDLFQAGGDRWMTYREPGEKDKDVTNYDLVHKAWTAVLGIRERTIEPAEPGTYGGIVRSWLPHPR